MVNSLIVNNLRPKIGDLETYQIKDLKEMEGEYLCPNCGGIMLCVNETKAGDAVYECQKCLSEILVIS